CLQGTGPLAAILPRASTGLPAALAARESGTGERSSHRIATSIRLQDAASAPGSCPRPRLRAFPRTRLRRELCPSLNSNTHPALPVLAASAPPASLLRASVAPPISAPVAPARFQRS